MDDYHDPSPYEAPSRKTVDAVLSRVSRAGNSVLSLLSGLLAAALILFSGYVLYDTVYTQNTAARMPYDLLRYRPEILDEGAEPVSGADKLSAVNADYRAWLTIYDGNIDYPVVQADDNVYYASHDIYGQISLTGAIYLAAGNSADFSDSYNLIYGHHMDNGAMFGTLDSFVEADYFDSHRDGMLVAKSGVYDLRTFAIVATDAYENKVYFVGDRMEEVLTFLRARYAAPDERTKVLIFDESALEGAEKILALSTCAGAETDGRLLLFAAMTRRNLITLDAQGYDGVYDAHAHGPAKVTVNYPEGTSYAYSLDNGVTWVDGLPTIVNVGETAVLLRAHNEIYGSATVPITLRVQPKPLTIKAKDSFKIYGERDPRWEIEAISGIVDGFVPTYTLRRENMNEERVGSYPGAIVPEGERYQGNYVISYLPGDFTIARAETLVLIANGYTGVYDAKPHGLSRLEVSIPDNTTIEYSTDGGRIWTNAAPTITNVGTVNVLVRASHANYSPATVNVTLQITPALVTVKARDAEKTTGEEDPAFTAEVIGLLDGQELSFTISRPGVGTDEAEGSYEGAIVPVGEEFQGNYRVIYEPGTMTINAKEPVAVPEPTPPPVERFTPSPSSGTPAWALVNLICMVLTAYLFLPLLRLKAKFGRVGYMKKHNEEKCALREASGLNEEQREERNRIYDAAIRIRERKDGNTDQGEVTEEEFRSAVEELYYHVRDFLKRFRLGLALELLTVAAAVIAFILTEDMRLPMILIDKWTPLMVGLLILCWLLDNGLIRYREKAKKSEEEKVLS